MRWRWVAACAAGEALGIAVVATTYAMVDRGLLSAPTIAILADGAWEGLVLGAAQALLLRAYGIFPMRWIMLTIAAAVLGYGLSLLGGAGSAHGTEVPVALQVALGAMFGAGMGIFMGAIQWLAARDVIAFRPWIAANAVGWAGAVAVIMFGATIAERSWPLSLVALIGAATGAVAGFCVGVATANALPSAAKHVAA